MKKPALPFLLLLAGSICFAFAVPDIPAPDASNTILTPTTVKPVESLTSHAKANLYDRLRLDTLNLSREAFGYAIEGMEKLQHAGKVKNKEVLSVVDFSLPSYKKRLFVINVATGELLFNTYVSHGRNSGKAMATRFSNKANSFQSSLGFYVTGQTYSGKHGYSLRLQGLEKGINDHAFDRNIVMHAADYATESFVKKNGYLGRSLGCPAIPVKLHRSIINAIKGGSCLFLYGTDGSYSSHSSLVKRITG